MLKTVGQMISPSPFQCYILLHNLNQCAEAEQVALEVLHIQEKAFGEESLPDGEALDCLVAIQTKLGKDDIKLLELLKRVLAIQEKGPSSGPERLDEWRTSEYRGPDKWPCQNSNRGLGGLDKRYIGKSVIRQEPDSSGRSEECVESSIDGVSKSE
ncbi:hypothetical protein TEA_003889 [Camellia sinensis var. sinensis]|uniref:Uncharacterized protein n=1 Tax=Camellia sinensis var. sinensis TaxID=542762 RepID=A0A4S4ERH6_CAMSN|nr:hypothetical protein TEA_003889 [Camellia sinensis var. sinensis]